ncbi:MAG: PH domain-containing protein [Arachnia sp.]
MSEEPTWPPPVPRPPTAPPTGPVASEPPPIETTLENPHPLTGVAKSWVALVSIIIVFGRDVLERGTQAFTELGPGLNFLLAAAGLIVIANLILGVISWRTTRFVADAHEFRIERNFWSRASTRIAYSKIQSVDVSRSLPARMLGLSSVQIDVGGAGGAKLEYLSRERAEALREQLQLRVGSLADVPAEANAATPGATAGPVPEAVRAVHVRPATLLLGTLTSWPITWGLTLALILWLASLGLPGGRVGTLGILLGLGGYLLSQLTGNWNFAITRGQGQLRISRGLFDTTNRSLNPARVQAVSISQDLLHRIAGLYRIRITLLGFDEDSGTQTSGLALPYGRWDAVLEVIAAIWPDVDLTQVELHGQPRRARWLTPLSFARHQWGRSAQVSVAFHGWLNLTISVVPHERMQSIEVSQGPLQRRLGLAKVSLHTTDGPVSLQLYHLDEALARSLLVSQIEIAATARGSAH